MWQSTAICDVHGRRQAEGTRRSGALPDFPGCHLIPVIPGTLHLPPPDTWPAWHITAWNLAFVLQAAPWAVCPTVCHQVALTCDMIQAFLEDRLGIDKAIDRDIRIMMRGWWSVLVMLKTWGWSIQRFALPALSEPINCRYRDSIMLQRFYACRSVCIDHTTKSCVGCIVKKKLHTWCC